VHSSRAGGAMKFVRRPGADCSGWSGGRPPGTKEPALEKRRRIAALITGTESSDAEPVGLPGPNNSPVGEVMELLLGDRADDSVPSESGSDAGSFSTLSWIVRIFVSLKGASGPLPARPTSVHAGEADEEAENVGILDKDGDPVASPALGMRTDGDLNEAKEAARRSLSCAARTSPLLRVLAKEKRGFDSLLSWDCSLAVGADCADRAREQVRGRSTIAREKGPLASSEPLSVAPVVLGLGFCCIRGRTPTSARSCLVDSCSFGTTAIKEASGWRLGLGLHPPGTRWNREEKGALGVLVQTWGNPPRAKGSPNFRARCTTGFVSHGLGRTIALAQSVLPSKTYNKNRNNNKTGTTGT